MVQITEGWSFLAWRVSRKPAVILCKWSSPRLNSELCFGLVKDLQKNFKDGMMINLIHNCNKNYLGPCWSTALSVPRKASPEILAVGGQPALRVICLTSWGLRLSQKRKGEAAEHGLSPLSASGLALCIKPALCWAFLSNCLSLNFKSTFLQGSNNGSVSQVSAAHAWRLEFGSPATM